MLFGVAAPSAGASGTDWYAYVGESASDNSHGYCTSPGTGASQKCDLTVVLSLAGSGDTIYLATPSSSGSYVGNWGVETSVTIEPAPGLTGASLDGNNGASAGCSEANLLYGCAGPVLGVSDLGTAPVVVVLHDLTIQNANATNALAGVFGGGVANIGPTVSLTVTNCTFHHDRALAGGGAIGNTYTLTGTSTGPGSVTVTDSRFSDNFSSQGGAIGNASTGTVTVTDSTFTANTALHGGAIDNGDPTGLSTLTVTGSTFTDNSSKGSGHDGGAIDNGDTGSGTATVTDSTFTANTAESDGGAIDNGDHGGQGTLTVTGSTFYGNSAADGGGIDGGDTGASATLSVANSTFSTNSASYAGGAVAIDSDASDGSATITA